MPDLAIGLNPPGCYGAWWTNQAIDVQSIPSGANGFDVGQLASITVNVVNRSAQHSTTIEGVQVAVFGITTAGQVVPQGLMPSLSPGGLVSPGPSVVSPLGGEFDAVTWTPQVADIHYFLNNGSWLWEDPLTQLTLHVCVFANVYGTREDGYKDGVAVDWTALSATPFCQDDRHAQRNAALQRLVTQMMVLVPFFAGYVGDAPVATARIGVTERLLQAADEPHVLAELERAGIRDLRIRPADAPGKAGVRLVRRTLPRQLPAGVSESDYEDVDTIAREELEVVLASGLIRPLLLVIEPEPRDEAGVARIFDVTQHNPDGTGGGFRLTTVTSAEGHRISLV